MQYQRPLCPSAIDKMNKELNPYETTLYLYLYYRRDYATKITYTNYSNIMKDLKLSDKTVAKHIKGLEEKGYLEIITTKKSALAVNYSYKMKVDLDLAYVTYEKNTYHHVEEIDELKKVIQILEDDNENLCLLLKRNGIPVSNLRYDLTEQNYQDILDYWVRLDLVKHKTVTKEIMQAIDLALIQYSAQEVLNAMDNYSEVYHDEKYFFNYLWTLSKFLSSPNGMITFVDDERNWIDYLNFKKRKR